MAKKGDRFSAIQKKGVHLSMKDALVECFVEMGGSPALAKWAKENQEEAYKLIFKHTIPSRVEMGGIDGEAIRMEMTNAAESVRRKLDSAIKREGGESPPRLTH